MLRSQRCAADPGPCFRRALYGSRLCGASRRALHRVWDTGCLSALLRHVRVIFSNRHAPRAPDAAQRVSGALLIRGPCFRHALYGSRLSGASRRALHRVRDTGCLSALLRRVRVIFSNRHAPRAPDAAQRVSGALLIRGPCFRHALYGSRLSGASRRALHRVRDTRYFCSRYSAACA